MAKRLTRSIKNKMLGGVCAGLADYFDLDVSLMRLIFIAISLVTAMVPMALFYIIAWAVIPPEPAAPAGEPAPPKTEDEKKP